MQLLHPKCCTAASVLILSGEQSNECMGWIAGSKCAERLPTKLLPPLPLWLEGWLTHPSGLPMQWSAAWEVAAMASTFHVDALCSSICIENHEPHWHALHQNLVATATGGSIDLMHHSLAGLHLTLSEDYLLGSMFYLFSCKMFYMNLEGSGWQGRNDDLMHLVVAMCTSQADVTNRSLNHLVNAIDKASFPLPGSCKAARP